MGLENLGTTQTKKDKAIAELQRLKTFVAAGTTAATDITVTGLTAKDTLQSVVMFASGVPSVVTGEASIGTNGKLQLSTTNSSGNYLLIHWYSKPLNYEK